MYIYYIYIHIKGQRSKQTIIQFAVWESGNPGPASGNQQSIVWDIRGTSAHGGYAFCKNSFRHHLLQLSDMLSGKVWIVNHFNRCNE